MILWFWDGYVNYAICILVISVLGVTENLYETVHNINQIRELAKYECEIQVKRDNQLVSLLSSDLLPGDVIVVPDNCVMPCDLVLLTG